MPVSSTTAAERCYQLVESAIADYFRQAARDAAVINPAYARLWKDMHELVLGGGKRLRPRMAYLSYRAFGGEDVAGFAPVAAATELLHLSLLIHDDIIDRDLMRYRVPNITARYVEHYASYITDAADRLHYAESAALLAGDLLLSGAHQMMAGSVLPDTTRAAVQAILSRGVFEVVGGQLLDTEAAFVDSATVQPLTIAHYKSASYSFVMPLLIGATAAGASEQAKATLRQFAEQLGLAFQLHDDILGVFGDSSVMGKSTTGDLREGKRTYLIESFEKLAAPADKAKFDCYFGKAELSDDQADSLRQLLEDSGARGQVTSKISELEAGAIAALAALKLSPAHHQEFLDLIHKALKRNS